MAKLSDQELEEIIRRELPGYRIVKGTVGDDAVASRVTADERTPDLAQLKEKLRGAGNPGPGPDEAEPNPGPDPDDPVVSDPPDPGGADAAVDGGAGDETPEDTMVAIEPDVPPNPWDHGAKPKVVVISGKDRKILSSQG
jgi:hypothetical protein